MKHRDVLMSQRAGMPKSDQADAEVGTTNNLRRLKLFQQKKNLNGLDELKQQNTALKLF